jgi:putative chitinase
MNIENLKSELPENVYSKLPELINVYKFDTSVKLSHFLSQCAKESGNFEKLYENMNYSADRLLVVFKKYFNRQKALLYANKPEKIANLVYGNRMGNGNELSGDGYRYRARGYIGLTFKNNYSDFSKFIKDDVVSNPDLVATKYPLESAIYFFLKNKILESCPKQSFTTSEEMEESVTCVTMKVNGGKNGLKDRILYFRKFYTLLIK